MECRYSDKALYLNLTPGLSKTYKGTVDGLRTNTTISTADKNMILRQFEEENNVIQRESAQVVYGRCRLPFQPNKMNASENESENDGCYLCESEVHYGRDCKFEEEILELGKKLGAKYMEQKSKKSSKRR
jgi:hypothetical protein